MIHISDEITLLIHLWKQTEKSVRAGETHPDHSVANQIWAGFASFLPLVESDLFARFSILFLMTVIRNNFTISALCMRSFIVLLF